MTMTYNNNLININNVHKQLNKDPSDRQYLGCLRDYININNNNNNNSNITQLKKVSSENIIEFKEMRQNTESPTPLQKKLTSYSKKLPPLETPKILNETPMIFTINED